MIFSKVPPDDHMRIPVVVKRLYDIMQNGRISSDTVEFDETKSDISAVFHFNYRAFMFEPAIIDDEKVLVPVTVTADRIDDAVIIGSGMLLSYACAIANAHMMVEATSGRGIEAT